MLKDPLAGLQSPDVVEFRQKVHGIARQWSESEVRDWERRGHLPRQAFQALGQAGCFEARWKRGRIEGLPYALVLTEELSLVSSGLALAMIVHNEVFVGILAARANNPRQREVYAAALRGDVIGCIASTEPDGGSDLSQPVTAATRSDDGWQITGTKHYITNAGRATHAIVSATVQDGSQRGRPTLFLVDLLEEGVEVTGYFDTMGLRDCETSAIQLDALVANDSLIGAVGAGPLYLARAFQLERVAGSMQLLTGARVALRLAGAHARRRSQFGRRLIDHQALRHKLADAACKLYAAQCVLGGVVALLQTGASADRETCCLKLVAARTAWEIADESLQVFGGRGYTNSYPLERILRDVRLGRIAGGTDEIMLEAVGHLFERSDDEVDAWLARLEHADRARLTEQR